MKRKALTDRDIDLIKRRHRSRERLSGGLCQRCGREPLSSKLHCATCLKAKAERNRKRYGFKPWQPGGRGRPPASYGVQPGLITQMHYYATRLVRAKARAKHYEGLLSRIVSKIEKQTSKAA